MSEYINAYKKRMELNGGSRAVSSKNHSKYLVAKNFKDDPSYRDALIIRTNGEVTKQLRKY